jgi:hypothetical protein
VNFNDMRRPTLDHHFLANRESNFDFNVVQGIAPAV